MIDLSGIGILIFAALGAAVGALLIIPLAIASFWIDGLMSWAWIAPVAGLLIGSMFGARAP
ncbi:hypothetical protein C7477_11845 [Phyllobacterium leguminum]|uniref:Uncharacterized protein n=1 Tax=Phyllobacterium leguminum TaxID=314237 RepID=A0A318T267_9HYPH|nr:hypothetical protein C7477_11845 [Phyllobacterium leguminum]